MNTFFDPKQEISKSGNNFGGRQLKTLREAVDEVIRQTDRAASDRLQWISDDDKTSLMALWFDLHGVLNAMEAGIRMAPQSDWIYEPTENTKKLLAEREQQTAA